MDWDIMRDQWQARSDDGMPVVQVEKPSSVWRRVRWRDYSETFIAVLLAPMFAWISIRTAQSGVWVTAVFAAMLVVVMIYITLRLRVERRKIPRREPQMPVLEFLHAERKALIAQRDMLLSVSRWYSAPIAIGVIGVYGGISGPGISLAVYVVVVMLLCIGIDRLNRYAAHTQFDGAIATIEQQIAILEDTS
ncbi:MAG: hypothetical protein AAF270_04540 [Pseudomonadota bacterium]